MADNETNESVVAEKKCGHDIRPCPACPECMSTHQGGHLEVSTIPTTPGGRGVTVSLPGWDD